MENEEIKIVMLVAIVLHIFYFYKCQFISDIIIILLGQDKAQHHTSDSGSWKTTGKIWFSSVWLYFLFKYISEMSQPPPAPTPPSLPQSSTVPTQSTAPPTQTKKQHKTFKLKYGKLEVVGYTREDPMVIKIRVTLKSGDVKMACKSLPTFTLGQHMDKDIWQTQWLLKMAAYGLKSRPWAIFYDSNQIISKNYPIFM